MGIASEIATEADIVVDVAVIGGGLSGLTTATRLQQGGATVAVLEARDRVGGRTLNAPIGDGRIVELGGQWVGPGQDRVKALAAELGIELFPTHITGDNVFLKGGRLSRYGGDVPWRSPLGLMDYRQAQKRLERMAKTIDVNRPAATARAAKWDTGTLATWIERHMHTRYGRALMYTAVEAILAADPADFSLLHFLFFIAAADNSLEALVATRGGAQQDRVVGGSQTISLRLAEQLGDAIHLEEPVAAIEQHRDGALLRTSTGTVIAARFVVIAVPPVLATHIDYSPALPAARLQLAQRMAPGTVYKCMAVYDTPFWREDGLTGHATCSDEGPVQVVFDNSPPDGGVGVLLGFILARDARRAAHLSPHAREQAVLERFARFFGEPALRPRQYLEKSWAAEPWTRGCYAGYMTPGGWTDYGDDLRAPIGRIHWAGSDTATRWHGSMDGAVSAGERAASEVLARLAEDRSAGRAVAATGV